MTGKMINKCNCGGGKPQIDIDYMTKTAFVECLACGRMVGGLKSDEAIKMWNAAMDTLKKPESSA